MPRRLIAPPGIPQHIVQRGVDRRTVFYGEEDKQLYLYLLEKYAAESQLAVHAYVLMDNHIHLLLTSPTEQGATQMMHRLNTAYVQYFNKRNERSGPLWEGRFRASLIDRVNYLLLCYRYIELNPVKAYMVEHPGEYPWSSYRSNARGAPSSLLSPHPEFLALATDPAERLANYLALFDQALSTEQSSRIQSAVRSGQPISVGQPRRGRPPKALKNGRAAFPN